MLNLFIFFAILMPTDLKKGSCSRFLNKLARLRSKTFFLLIENDLAYQVLGPVATIIELQLIVGYMYIYIFKKFFKIFFLHSFISGSHWYYLGKQADRAGMALIQAAISPPLVKQPRTAFSRVGSLW